jgi:hypothetical protein
MSPHERIDAMLDRGDQQISRYAGRDREGNVAIAHGILYGCGALAVGLKLISEAIRER